MWDFQLCTTLVDPIGFGPDSMFPDRKWTYEDLTKYCQSRYGEQVVPQPYALVRNLGFDDLIALPVHLEFCLQTVCKICGVEGRTWKACQAR